MVRQCVCGVNTLSLSPPDCGMANVNPWRLPVVLSAVLIASCGGGGQAPSGGSDAGDADRASAQGYRGHVIIEERFGRFHLDAWFTNSASNTASTEAVLYDNGGDRCWQLGDDAAQGSLDTQQLVSAGDSLRLSSRDGVWTELVAQPGIDAPVYATELRSIREAWPDDVVLDIPGAEFPEMPTTALNLLAPLVVNAPTANRNLPEDGRLLWVASEDARDQIELDFRRESPGGTTAGRSTLRCIVADDGEFTLPQNLQQQAHWIARAARTRHTVVGSGDAELVVAQISER